MRKYLVVIVSILCLSFILSCFTYKSNAALGLDSLNSPSRYTSQDGSDNQALINIGNIIVWLVRTIGEAVSVIMLLIIGIKYLLSSVEEKAEYKQTIWVYILRSSINICRFSICRYNL